MKKYNILIGDDDKTCLRYLKRAFESSNFTVTSSLSCKEIIELTKTNKFDCFLLDYNFNDGTALDICRVIRADKSIQKVLIVILSGYSEERSKSYNDCQADMFIEKDKTPKQILPLIKGLLRRIDWERGTNFDSDLILDFKTLSVMKGDETVASLSKEQFSLFSLLFENVSNCVSEESAIKCLFQKDDLMNKKDAFRSLMCRLRQNLGPKISRRIKNKRGKGWFYYQPRLNNSKI
ncbi:MAG: response regulator transcription factor [Elusimicrobiales bacterium]|nr:response regulator transcription factor [Elusimicrobiales bacterium]MCK5357821.1 response regulator transcription factor [Elusimicrobiales bacterium]